MLCQVNLFGYNEPLDLVTDFWLGLDTFYEDAESLIHPSVLDLIMHGVALNTAGIITRQSSESPFQVSGSPLKRALLSWAAQNLHADVDRIRHRFSIITVDRISVVEYNKNNEDGTMDVHCKEDTETILGSCSRFYTFNGTLRSLNVKEQTTFPRSSKVWQSKVSDALRWRISRYPQCRCTKVMTCRY